MSTQTRSFISEKDKVARNEKGKKLHGFSYYQNIANFEAFWLDKNFSKNLLFLGSVFGVKYFTYICDNHDLFYIFQALDKVCKAPGGYTGIKNVYQIDSPKDDVQQSFFLAESLKVIITTVAHLVHFFFCEKRKLRKWQNWHKIFLKTSEIQFCTYKKKR